MTYSPPPNNTPLNNFQLTIDKPAIYCIRVIGDLDESWSDRLAGMKITSSDKEGNQTISTLSGTITDQAALFGVLKALYDMRLPLLFVECLKLE